MHNACRVLLSQVTATFTGILSTPYLFSETITPLVKISTFAAIKEQITLTRDTPGSKIPQQQVSLTDNLYLSSLVHFLHLTKHKSERGKFFIWLLKLPTIDPKAIVPAAANWLPCAAYSHKSLFHILYCSLKIIATLWVEEGLHHGGGLITFHKSLLFYFVHVITTPCLCGHLHD